MMTKVSRSWSMIIIMVVATLLLLAACGGDEEPAPTSAPTSAAAPAAPESPLPPESPLSSPSSDGEVSEVVAQATGEPYSATMPSFPTSQPETGTVVGRLISSTTGQPVNSEIVRLAEVECPKDVEATDKRSQCVWTLSNAFSPSSFTDEDGFFIFNDLEPRDYVLIIGDMIGKNTKIADENGPYMWAAVADEVTDIGEFHIEW